MKLPQTLTLFICALVAGAPTQAQTVPAHDNVALTQLFDADQSVRETMTAAQRTDQQFLARMIADDAARRARTQQLIDAGQLSTADDFYHAAFIFQHGSTPNDYLLAHSLALASAARGNGKAAWIAAATLDRYLLNIGQKQIYGTQFRNIRNGHESGWSMEPYDRALVPDTLRQALGVPPQAQQAERLARMKANDTPVR